MKKIMTRELLGVAGLCMGVALLTGCQTRYSEDCSFGSVDGGSVVPLSDGGALPVAEGNPMPAAVAPVKPGNVTYPDPKPPKTPEYWQDHSDPYAGMTRPAAPASGKGASAGKAAPAGYTVHVVQKGETLGGIAQKNHVRLADVKAANGGINYDRLLVGQRIYIPASSAAKSKAPASGKAPAAAAAKDAPGTYVVKPGDVLGRIARQHGVKVADLKAANGLKSDKIVVGQKLKIPGKAAAAPSADPAAKADAAKKPAATATQPLAPELPAPELTPPPAPAVDTPPAAPELEAPALAPSAAPAPKTTPHIVKKGEDLFSIAIRWSVGVSEIQAVNPNLPDPLTEGTVVQIPVK